MGLIVNAESHANVYRNDGCAECDYTGGVIGKVQPYVEHIIFTDKLKSDLLACKEPYEMEQILKAYVTDKGQRLEDYMIDDIAAGKLDVNCLNAVI